MDHLICFSDEELDTLYSALRQREQRMLTMIRNGNPNNKLDETIAAAARRELSRVYAILNKIATAQEP